MTQFLGPAAIREIAAALELRPTKSLGQNFLHDANTIRKIVRVSAISAADVVLEVGPGLGSLTLGLLDTGARVIAVEIDPRLAAALGPTVGSYAPEAGPRLEVRTGDALALTAAELADPEPTALVANLPYNIAVPVLLTLLERLPTLRHGLILVQAEVAARLAAGPGEAAYGAPSVKAAWYARVRRAGPVSRQVFWPVPNVDSGLVSFTCHPPPPEADRAAVFAVVDAAFGTRRKGLRAALASWAGSAPAAEQVLHRAGIDPRTRGEALGVAEFVAIARAAR